MAIKIKSLKPDTLSEKSLEKQYLYKDLLLDLTPQVFLNKQLNKREALKDVAALFDEEAVKNAVANIFLTAPGDKILNPTFGLDLRQFLFEPIDNFTTILLDETIRDGLPIMDPRLEITNVFIFPNPDENTYRIDLQINVPTLNIYGLHIKSELNSMGYVIL